MIAECRLYLYSIVASNCLEKGSELLFGHCANISSEWKLPKGGSHYQKRQSAKNRFDVGIVVQLLSEESIMVQILPTVQHELHSRILLCLFNKCLPLLLQSPWSLQWGQKNYSLWRFLNFAKCFDLPPFWATFATTMVPHYAHQITEGTVFKDEI